MSENIYIKRIDELLIEGRRILQTDICVDEEGARRWNWSSLQNLYSWENSSLNIIFHLVGSKSNYYQRFPRFRFPDRNPSDPDFFMHFDVNIGIGCLMSIKNEIESGLVFSTNVMITKDILSNILFESQGLLNAGYNPAAAIYCRVYTENLMKKIADNNDISYTNKTKLNTIILNLKNQDILQQPDWRLIQSWLDIGNEAAHGNFDNCTSENIIQMIKGLSIIEERYLK